ncbi:hypothetical protein JHK84_034079 [Glycine max]|nr:hypothetical protein JHK84_034079 [Glycine max]
MLAVFMSPDCLLQQSSTVEDSISFKFSDGITKSIPCSYTEFAERLVMPQYKNLPDTEVKELHRRDGFEVVSADKMAKSCMVYFEMHLSLRKKKLTKAFNGTIIGNEDIDSIRWPGFAWRRLKRRGIDDVVMRK